ncbi:MAG: hypothetical protein J1F67_07145 [Muribaculaceae bacterium]|nr:hypothetical protein [Muribaculaceae bacterium]
MRISRRFINFALIFCIGLLPVVLLSCKGRTAENMEPTGDTIEVVIMQNPNVEN